MATMLIVLLISLALPFSFILASSRTLDDAVDTLSLSGYLSMALTLHITSNTLNLESSSSATAITIFAPWDPAFVHSGQLSLLQLQSHISPTRFSSDSFSNILALGSRIPTLASNYSLIITTSTFDGRISINGVSIQESPLYDDGSLVIFGTDYFLRSSFDIAGSPAPEPEPEPELSPSSSNSSEITADLAPGPSPSSSNSYHHQESSSGLDLDAELLGQASGLLMCSGYSIMATLLDAQLFAFTNETRLTIFAPVDEAIEAYAKNVSDYSLIFRRHAVPRLLSWKDIVGLDGGTVLPTFSGGFMINVTRPGGGDDDAAAPVFNGVPVMFPETYCNQWLMVHGLRQLLMSPLKQGLIGDSLSELDDGEYEQNPSDYGEYGVP